ncbi:MAG TPA: peptidyl-prolyl cis-trans isomerase [Polyangium sp.]|nr:peptidyl-prolyl cis-trans isomerase [Polyangium sp.]
MRTSRFHRVAFAAALALGLGTVCHSVVFADAGAPAEDTTPVAKVGTRVFTISEVERRIASVPAFQLRYFGKSTEEIRRRFVDETLIKDALLVQGAEAEKISETVEVAERIRGVLRGALIKKITDEAAAAGPITDDEVKAYYEANKSTYHAPARIVIWRIVVATKEEAAAVIEQVKTDLTPKKWNEIAREKSLDKATNMRGGNLGFVDPTGATSDPNLKVDAALVTAAEKVKDGELVQEPVADESKWSVLWRRQSMKAVDRPLEMEAAQIRMVLMKQRTDKRIADTIAELRKKNLGETNPDLLELLAVSGMGEVSPVKRPGTLPSARRPASGSPVPMETPNGKR